MAVDPFSAGAQVAGALVGAYTSRKAAKEQKKATRNAMAREDTQEAQQRADLASSRQLGGGANVKIARNLGIGGVSGYDSRVVGSKSFKPSEVGDLLAKGYSVDDILQLGRLESDVKTSDINWLMANRDIGMDDLARLKSGTFSPLEGATTRTDQGTAYEEFTKTPGFDFRLQTGTQARNRLASAGGGLNSGNTLIELEKYGQNLASDEYGNYMNDLFQAASLGANATNTLVGADLSTSGRAADSEMTLGDIRASGVVGQGNALNDLLGGAAAIGSDWWANRKQTPVNPRTSGVKTTPRRNMLGPY